MITKADIDANKPVVVKWDKPLHSSGVATDGVMAGQASEFITRIEEESEFDLIREKTVALKPQSVEEAILQMNLLGHQFYMFLNADTGIINLVYGRKDSGYGLIIPDYDD